MEGSSGSSTEVGSSTSIAVDGASGSALAFAGVPRRGGMPPTSVAPLDVPIG
jgi:hypothetical protein